MPVSGLDATIWTSIPCAFSTAGLTSVYYGMSSTLKSSAVHVPSIRRLISVKPGEGKRTLILIHLLSRCTESEKEGLRRFLATPRPHRLAKDVRRVYRLLAKYDCIESARRSAYQLAGAALREYHVAYRGLPDSEDKRFVENIIFYMIERNI